MSYANAKAQIETSLKTSGFDYIDLMLIHSPYGGSAARKEVWKALVEAVEEGKSMSSLNPISNYTLKYYTTDNH